MSTTAGQHLSTPVHTCPRYHFLHQGGLFEEGGDSDELKMLDDCVGALASLVMDARVSDPDVEAERSIIVEEWRGRTGASERAAEKQIGALLKGSRYAHRMPIGTLPCINGVPGSTVRNFYRDRYHPKMMAVIAVGDFDQPNAVVKILQVRMVSERTLNALNTAPR